VAINIVASHCGQNVDFKMIFTDLENRSPRPHFIIMHHHADQQQRKFVVYFPPQVEEAFSVEQETPSCLSSRSLSLEVTTKVLERCPGVLSVRTDKVATLGAQETTGPTSGPPT
jgi:hypothetical protein